MNTHIHHTNQKMEKCLNILLLSQEDQPNLGDLVINRCTKWLVKKITEELMISCNIRSCYIQKGQYVNYLLQSDLIIFVGGGIVNYRDNTMVYQINAATRLAKSVGIPVIFNAVGVEGYDEKQENCLVLKAALNRHCVKLITTRDDLPLLKTKYIEQSNKHAVLGKVADPAVWTKDVYKIEKEGNADIIGLGIIRSAIFKNNGIAFDEQGQIELWKSIIGRLEEKNYNWVLFTNGLQSDYDFAEKIIESLGLGGDIQKYLLPKPTADSEIVKTIAGFKGIIAARMHANVIAYSLGIPSVGLVWNNKLSMFGNEIDRPDNFIPFEQFDGVKIVDRLEHSLYRKKDEEFFNSYKLTLYNSLKEFIKEFVSDELFYHEKKYCYNNKRKIIFGVGNVTRNYIKQDFYESIEYFIDNNAEMQNTYLYGKRILSPQNLLQENIDEILVIVNTFVHFQAISEQLSKLGLKHRLHFCSINEYLVSTNDDIFLEKEWKEREPFLSLDTVNWENRVQVMSCYLDSSVKSVLDLGCGSGKLRKYLQAYTNYYGVDYVKRNDSTILCDFNSLEFPDISCDAAFISGVLEYIEDTDWFFDQISRHCKQIVISYNSFELRPDYVFRKGEAWVNNFTTPELINQILKYGYKLSASQYYYPYQVLFNFTKD